MSVVKSSNTPCNTKGGLKAVIDYIFAEEKSSPDLMYVTGNYMDLEVTPQKILRNFMETKEMFDKTDKRQCKQFVIAWHEDSPITHAEALDICKEWAEKVFPDFTCAIAVHTNKDHVHGHILLNSVSYVDGTKYHMNPWQLTEVKNICDQINIEHGFSITEKGKHYDGTDIAAGTIRSDNKKTYTTVTKKDNSKLVNMAAAVIDAMNTAISKNDFIATLDLEYGIDVDWRDTRKYITFTDTDSGFKVRNNKLGNLITIDLDKEKLLYEFSRNANLQENLAHEKAEINEKCGILEDTIRELGRRYSSFGGESRANEAENSTVGGRTGNCSYREWPVERLAGDINDAEKRIGALAEWGKNAIRKLGNYLNLFRNSGVTNGTPSKELEWEARQLADKLEQQRFNIAGTYRDMQLHIIPNLGRNSYFEEALHEEYQEILERLGYYKLELQRADPMVLILAHAKMQEIRPREESYNINRSFGLEANATREEFEKASREGFKYADSLLMDIPTAMNKLIKEHNLEPFVTRGAIGPHHHR